MEQRGSHRDGGDHGVKGGVDSGESGDVAFAGSFKTDFLVDGPSVGDGAFSRVDLGAEFDSLGQRVVADHLVFRRVHHHVQDLQSTGDIADGEVGGVGGTAIDTAEREFVHAGDAGTSHLEGQDGAFSAREMVQHGGVDVEGGDSEDVAANDVGADIPAFAFSALGEGDGVGYVGEVLTQVDVHLGGRHIALVVEEHLNGDDVIEVAVEVSSDADGVHAGLHILCADGHIVVRHDELPRLFGEGVFLAVVGVLDPLHTEAGIRGGNHLDGGGVGTFVNGIGGQGTVFGIQHGDVVDIQQEFTADNHIFTGHDERVGFTRLDVDGVAVPGEATKTVTVVRGHGDGHFVVFRRMGDTAEGAVLDGFVRDVVVDGGVFEEQARHLMLVVGIKVSAGTSLGIHSDEVEPDGGSLPPVQFIAVTFERHGLRVLGHVGQVGDKPAVPVVAVDGVQLGVGLAVRVGDAIHDTFHVNSQRDPVVRTH